MLTVTCGLLFIVVFKLHAVLPVLPRPALILSPIALFLAWRQSGVGERSILHGDRLLWAVSAYCLWAMLSVPASIYRSLSLESVIGLLPLLMMFAVMCLLPATIRTVDRLLLYLMIGGVLLGLYSIAANLRMDGRLSAPSMFDPNDLGAVMAVTAALALGLILRGKGLWRISAIAALAICAFTLSQTSSRGSSIGFAVAVITVVLFSGGTRRITGTLLFVVGGAIFAANMPESYKARMATVGEEDYNTTDYYGRMQVWRRGSQYALSNPVLGVGVGAFVVAEGNRLVEQGRAGKWSSAHNAYIQSFAELGFPGGLLFLGLVGSSLVIAVGSTALSRNKNGVKRHERPEFLGACLGLAVASVFLSFAYFPLWFSLWGIASLLQRCVRNDSPSSVAVSPSTEGMRWSRMRTASAPAMRRAGTAARRGLRGQSS